MVCHVSNQIAEYCNQEEVYCPECNSEMTFDFNRHDVLVCDNEECDCEIYPEDEM